MEDLKEDRYLLKANSYLIDLKTVDFLTWKENDKEEGTYWTKLHIGTKECRYVCDSLTDLNTLVQAWSLQKGLCLEVEDEELITAW
tara:strand:+ start:1964 stop:2221 length:258 start_codon:yes stop_codon:yes gene_type:complete